MVMTVISGTKEKGNIFLKNDKKVNLIVQSGLLSKITFKNKPRNIQSESGFEKKVTRPVLNGFPASQNRSRA
jgi:hypothetical protein